MFASRFGIVNNSRGPEYFFDVARGNGALDDSATVARMRAFWEHTNTVFAAMSEAIVELARAIPDTCIVVRPHPSEDAEHWQRIADRAPNLCVVREGPITPWLLATDLLLHSNCTTGLEAFLLGRPTVAFVPAWEPRFDDGLPNAVSQRAATASELVDLVRANLDVDKRPHVEPAAHDPLVRRHIASLDGPLASECLVRAFDEIDLPSEPLFGSRLRQLRNELSLTPIRVERVLRRARALSSQSSEAAGGSTTKAPTARFPGMLLTDVRDFVDRAYSTTGRFGNVECLELDQNVFAVAARDS